MYAIVFDLEVSDLETHYPDPDNSYQNAYEEVRKFLEAKGFTRQQGNVYFGDIDKIDAVKCVMAVNALSQQLPWFKECVTDIRMLRIEDDNYLTPALGAYNELESTEVSPPLPDFSESSGSYLDGWV